MEIGTADILDNVEPKSTRPKRSSPGDSIRPKGGGGRGPSDGGGDGPDDNSDPRIGPQAFVPGKSRIFTGFLLVVVMMTFGGLMAAYIVVATNKALEWNPFDLPIQIWISTGIILASSLAFHLGKKAVDVNDQPKAKKWFIVTTVLGAAFISSQLLAWLELTARGLYMSGNPYAGFFYLLTAVHALHVLGGVIALGAILLRVWYPSSHPQELLRRVTIAQVVGWYWHLIGALWIGIFVLLGFWK